VGSKGGSKKQEIKLAKKKKTARLEGTRTATATGCSLEKGKKKSANWRGISKKKRRGVAKEEPPQKRGREGF